MQSALFQISDMKFADTNLFIKEGLTEFLATLVLKKHHPLCYQLWKARTFEECKTNNDYHPSMRMWATFSAFIPVVNIVKFYFYDGTSRPWELRWRDLMESIYSHGYTGFRDIFHRESEKIAHEAQFLDQCNQHLPRFSKFYEGVLDLNKAITDGLPYCPVSLDSDASLSKAFVSVS